MTDTYIEVHGYAMHEAEDGQGYTLAPTIESAEFFDIAVLRYHKQSGEIETVEERDNIKLFDDAVESLAGLERKYPTADSFEWLTMS
jgi:hypothetical protein